MTKLSPEDAAKARASIRRSLWMMRALLVFYLAVLAWLTRSLWWPYLQTYRDVLWSP